MITSKQRAYLRKLSNDIKPIFQIGKGGINENLIGQINDTLEVRELVKVHILGNSSLETKEVCSEIANMVKAEPVLSIGSNFVLYKESKENKEIILPK